MRRSPYHSRVFVLQGIAGIEMHLDLIVDESDRCVEAGPKPLLTGVFSTLNVDGQSLADVLTPELRELFSDHIKQARDRERSSFQCELEKPKRRLSVNIERRGSHVQVRGSVEEIPDPFRRGGSDEALDVLHFVLEHLDHGVLLQGPNAEILMSNDAALRLLGLSEAQLLGSSSFDPRWHVIRADGSDFPGEKHPVPEAIRIKSPVRDVLMGVFRPTTNDRVWLRVDAIPELDAAGDVTRVLCSFTDVTEKKFAEEELRRDHSLLTQIMESSLAGVCVLNPDGQIIFANRAAEEILGLSRKFITQLSYDAPEWRTRG
ncbi:MAG: PAS domain-containing protein, partial [Myxococcota bacterium]